MHDRIPQGLQDEAIDVLILARDSQVDLLSLLQSQIANHLRKSIEHTPYGHHACPAHLFLQMTGDQTEGTGTAPLSRPEMIEFAFHIAELDAERLPVHDLVFLGRLKALELL